MSVFMGDNGRSFLTQPLIAIRVVEVPVSIDQMRNGIAAEAVGGLQDSWAGPSDSGVDKHLAIGAS
jgi:hypothetical protein